MTGIVYSNHLSFSCKLVVVILSPIRISVKTVIIYNRADFTSIAKWVANADIDPHIVEVVYALLDENGDRLLSIEEFSPVLFQWRKSRGFQHQTVQISLGQLKV